MRIIKQFAGTGTLRGLPLLLLAYAALMTHFIFGRAFRDSLLGSHLAIRSLPSLTMWSTLVSIVVSLMVSSFFRSTRRSASLARDSPSTLSSSCRFHLSPTGLRGCTAYFLSTSRRP